MAKKEAGNVQDNKTVELPSAKELMKQIAQKEAEKASEYMRQQSAAEREKKALIERLTKPSGVSDEEALRRAMVDFPKGMPGDVGITLSSADK